MLAAVAEATRRIEIGPLVVCNFFRNPAILAKQASAVDEISHGRLTVVLSREIHATITEKRLGDLQRFFKAAHEMIEGQSERLVLGLIPARAHTKRGTVSEIAAAMRGYEEMGMEHLMFQCEPYTDESVRRLTEALHVYRDVSR